uniref:Uncharacterized protein n=1 Tax=Anopheles minimus TaxID=112268 RepID=A0A182VVS1_9DIPT
MARSNRFLQSRSFRSSRNIAVIIVKMSDYEKLEQALAQFLSCSKDADSEASTEKFTTDTPPNEQGKATTKVVAQATDKLTESLGILHDFEMLLYDKTASLQILFNELVLNALFLHEQKIELMEQRKRLRDLSGKWHQSSETVATNLENLCATINEAQ